MKKYPVIILLSFVCVLCGLPQSIQASGKIYLVAVGVADYPGTDMDLHLPAKDAKAIRYLYQKNNKAETLLLTDSQATRSAILSSMNRLFAKAQSNDIIVLFFSGHGYRGGFCAYDALLDYKDIRKSMAASKAKNKMIFADACFSGKMRENRRSTSPSSLNVMLFLSSRDTETSLESPSMKNGFFTAALERALRGGADANRDRIITAKELFTFVSKAVKEATRDKQHPVMWGKFSDTMPVISW